MYFFCQKPIEKVICISVIKTKPGSGRKLKCGSLPSKFLPLKSVGSPAAAPRKEPVRINGVHVFF